MENDKLTACACGEQPELAQIGEWPAQYRATCKCGESAIGAYYGSHDRDYRHSAAKKAATQAWNGGEREAA